VRLALGTAQFGMPYGVANQVGQITLSEAKKILQFASDHGIDVLDTAISYGESEIRLGQVGIQDFKVVTKIPAIPIGCNNITEWASEQITDSMSRLGVKSLYGLLLHRSEDLLSSNGKLLYETLLKFKDDGKAQKLGVSIYSPHELDNIDNIFNIDLVQTPFNIVDQRLHLSGWLDRLQTRGIEVHTRSVFLQGLLLMRPSDRPSKFKRWSAFWSKWDAWIEQTGITPLSACIRFACTFPQISRLVVGVDSIEQLQEILLASKGAPLEVPSWQNEVNSDLFIPSNWAALS
jgi:aryl-alcohol dehydrogenase-like predicted oxidoreductase